MNRTDESQIIGVVGNALIAAGLPRAAAARMARIITAYVEGMTYLDIAQQARHHAEATLAESDGELRGDRNGKATQ